jgi:hypothetical protein
MASLRIDLIQRVDIAGQIWDVNLEPGLNLLIGDPNTSKTTTLRIADFCLGDDDSAEGKFGRNVADEYAQFALQITANGQEHLLIRRVREPGQTRRVDVDGQLMDTRGFNDWIAEALGWGPPVRIPRGLSAAATEEIPLTFRVLYRHLYRRWNSWTNFAYREEEYFRRAVVAFFLGVASDVYGGQQVEITKREQDLAALEQERRSLRTMLDRVVQQMAGGFRETGITGLDSIGDARDEVTNQISEVRDQHQRLMDRMRGEPTYDARLDAALGDLHQQIGALAQEVHEVGETLEAQHRLIATLDADVQRLVRARIATTTLGSIMVTNCPACHQAIVPLVETDSEERRCYVCHQVVSPDLRERRLQLEERAIQNDKLELEQATEEIEQRLQDLTTQRQSLVAQREALQVRIEEERRELITPLLREAQQLQYRLGQLEQRKQSLERLSQLQDYVSELDAKRATVEQRVAELKSTSAARAPRIGLIHTRTSRLAEFMNQFVNRLSIVGGIGGLVSISDLDFEFYVGQPRWDQTLGGERLVLFLLAYHYAYLRLVQEEEIPHPGLVIFDNPFQQDVLPHLVQEGLQQFADLCQGDDRLQVILTTSRQLQDLHAHRIRFERVFNPEGVDPTLLDDGS